MVLFKLTLFHMAEGQILPAPRFFHYNVISLICINFLLFEKTIKSYLSMPYFKYIYFDMTELGGGGQSLPPPLMCELSKRPNIPIGLIMIDGILIRTQLMCSSKTRAPQPTALSRGFY